MDRNKSNQSTGGLVVFASVSQLPVWKTSWVGGKTREQWLDELKMGGNWISSYVKDMISSPHFTMFGQPIEIELIRAEVQHLGFADESNLPATADLFQQAKLLGFSTDIQEAGPAARLMAEDGDCFSVLSEPIPDCDGFPNVFYSYHRRAGRRIGAHDARPQREWDLDGELVLVRCKHA